MSSGESRPVSIHRRHGRWSPTFRQLERERLPVRVQDDVDGEPLHAHRAAQGDAVRVVAPIRFVQPDAVPDQVRLAQEGR